MGRLDNLTPFNTLPPERRHEIAVKGGKARAAQRRAQRLEVERIKAEERARRELQHEDALTIERTARLLLYAAKALK